MMVVKGTLATSGTGTTTTAPLRLTDGSDQGRIVLSPRGNMIIYVPRFTNGTGNTFAGGMGGFSGPSLADNWLGDVNVGDEIIFNNFGSSTNAQIANGTVTRIAAIVRGTSTAGVYPGYNATNIGPQGHIATDNTFATPRDLTGIDWTSYDQYHTDLDRSANNFFVHYRSGNINLYSRGGTPIGIEGTIFPADRCSWTQVDNATGGYDISNARFTGANGSFPIVNPELGFIGKSGRFVKITQ